MPSLWLASRREQACGMLTDPFSSMLGNIYWQQVLWEVCPQGRVGEWDHCWGSLLSYNDTMACNWSKRESNSGSQLKVVCVHRLVGTWNKLQANIIVRTGLLLLKSAFWAWTLLDGRSKDVPSVCLGNEYMVCGSHKTTPCAAQQCIWIFSGTSANKSGNVHSAHTAIISVNWVDVLSHTAMPDSRVKTVWYLVDYFQLVFRCCWIWACALQIKQ